MGLRRIKTAGRLARLLFPPLCRQAEFSGSVFVPFLNFNNQGIQGFSLEETAPFLGKISIPW
jgi:hypothetical protein